MGNYFIPDPDAKKQNYFLEIIPLDMSISSKKFGIDDKIGLIEVEKVRSASKVENTEIPKIKEKKKCFCNRDFEESDVRELVKLLKGRETIWEGYKTAPCNIDDKSFSRLTKELNTMFKKYSINHCAQKLHFLAQAAHETDNFTLSEETKGNEASSQSVYKGRGVLQMTGEKVNSKYYDEPGPFKTYGSYSGINSLRNPEILSDQIRYCIDSGGWMYSVFKKMPSDKNSTVWKRWGEHKEKTIGKSLNELALYGDEYLELISALLNGRNSNTDMPNGWTKRQRNYDLLKTGFFNYDFYHNGKQKTDATGTNIVTYHIYADGRIEKHIPKTIKSGYENKYKYVYHDKNDNKYTICTVKWEKINKIKHIPSNLSSIPEGYTSDEPFNVTGVNQKHVYYYADGTIIATGKAGEGNGTKIIKYEKTKDTTILVKVPDSIKYNYGSVNINLTFKDTIRKYMGADHLGALIGALAKGNFTIVSGGAAMNDGTCFPSVSHVNGQSIDTAYLSSERTQEFVDALAFYGFNSFYYKPKMKLTKPKDVKTFLEKLDHSHHLHTGATSIKITEIYL